MRIISGKNKGRRIIAPSKLPVRPTTDLAKESLFNILNNHFYLEEISVLDLFSGTGNISYEFASRGCLNITSVDADNGCVRFIEKTSKELEYDIRVIKSDVYKFLERASSCYDLIFADPPYEFSNEQFERIVNLVFEKGILATEGFLVIEHSVRTDLSQLPQYSHSKKYGGNLFSFFMGEESEEN